MSLRAFSSIVLRELIKEIEKLREGLFLQDADWAAAATRQYHEAIQEQPLVYLTEEDYELVIEYLAWYKSSGLDVAARATQFIRGNHAAEIIAFLKTKYDGMAWNDDYISYDIQHPLPSNNDGVPTCFKEWLAIAQVWRLTLAMPETPFQFAESGDCLLSPLPKLWEDKLDQCMQITDASGIVPAPIGYGLRLTRRDINSILPESDASTDPSGLLTGTLIDRWFRMLVSHRNQRKPRCTVYIHPDSLDLFTATPQEVAERTMMVSADIDMILFPTIITTQDHCVLLVALPQKHVIAVYDSLGYESTRKLQSAWVKGNSSESETECWEVQWVECPRQGEEDACGVFMFTNALFLCSEKDPLDGYSQEDVFFLRRYIAAVICMGELPPNI
ncbi:MAG: hypothetical protein ALECFALPRED_010691 [Alectoria fallacina]|uniref:Ubiquitin-like protease family profile domain-containing protein n=1 Tax=Alectoria fallacina TaxID=1903189 RepID=A0A8H3J9K7_9LECA|nr:MAG: hypothetical protein ALECFALPRED_010691 [Alectoria fallacina]